MGVKSGAWLRLVHQRMAPFLLFIFYFSLQARALSILNRTEIESISTKGCILLGLINDDPLLTTLLEEMSDIYREEEAVAIGLASREDITWSSNANGGKFEAELAFYKRQPPDRSCLLSAAHRPTAEPYAGQLVLEALLGFLNHHCHSYRKKGGGLESGGILRENLLTNRYRVSKNEESCIVVDSLTLSQFFWEHLSVSRPVVVRGAVKNWPAMKKWSKDYLYSKYGRKRVHVKITQDGVFEGVEPGSLWPGYSEDRIPKRVKNQLSFPDLVVVRPATDEILFGDFLDLVSEGRNKSGISSYLEYSSIPSYLPALEEDITKLSFVGNLLERKHLNIWLSDGDTLGKLHFDPYDNLLCQVRLDEKVIAT